MMIIIKTRYDWVGKGIHREPSKKLKSDHTNKWYIHNPESILENETHQLLWDFEIQTDHLIEPYKNQQQQKKRTGRIVKFAIPADHRVKLKESKKEDK